MPVTLTDEQAAALAAALETAYQPPYGPSALDAAWAALTAPAKPAGPVLRVTVAVGMYQSGGVWEAWASGCEDDGIVDFGEVQDFVSEEMLRRRLNDDHLPTHWAHATLEIPIPSTEPIEARVVQVADLDRLGDEI